MISALSKKQTQHAFLLSLRRSVGKKTEFHVDFVPWVALAICLLDIEKEMANENILIIQLSKFSTSN